MKCLWVVGGGVESIPGIQTARDLGCVVVLSDGNPSAPGRKYADHFYQADTYSPEENLIAARSFHQNNRTIDGVIAFAADVPLTVATLTDFFCLPGQTVNTAKIASNKFLMKKTLKEHEINIPWFTKIESLEALEEIVAAQKDLFILKPVDSRGARGVLQISKNSDLDFAFSFAMEHSPSKSLILEKFLSGPQFSTESIMHNSIPWHVGFADRNYSGLKKWHPFVIENGGSQPSFVNPRVMGLIQKEAARAATAMGLTDGIFKGDMVLHAGRPYVIEIATRLSGGWFSSIQIPASTGVPFVKNAILQALGEDIPNFGQHIVQRRPVAIRYIMCNTEETFNSSPSFEFPKSRFLIKAQFLKHGLFTKSKLENHTDRIGFVISRGFTRRHAIWNANRLIKKIKKKLLL